MNFTEEQQAAIDSAMKQNTYIVAGAGSGKSTTLAKIAQLTLAENPNNKVLLITFTNKSAQDIIDKVGGHSDRMNGGTFHSIAYKLMRRNGISFNICDTSKQNMIIKKLFDCKKDKKEFETIKNEISITKSDYPQRECEYTTRYNAELARYNMYDFDDIIFNGIEFIKEKKPLFNYTHILVDELQDTSKSQLEILLQLQKKYGCRMIGVGDKSQCQPGNTKVLTTNGYKTMFELDPNVDKIPSYVQHGSYIVGLQNGYSFQKSERNYTGILYGIKIGTKVSEATDTHKWRVKWNTNAKDKYVVYLMKQHDKFRIGYCKLFLNSSGFHLGQRARIENADAAWVLKVCDNTQQASMWESLYSTKYSIPLIMFKENKGSTIYTQNVLDFIFDELNHYSESHLPTKANILLNDFNLSINYPLWNKELHNQKQGGTQIFTTQSCNLLSDVMLIPEHISNKKIEWKEFKISHKLVNNKIVYSLNVEPHHTYIADGIVTENSIYEWRGAQPENVDTFIKKFKCKIKPLAINFRSKNNIVEHSRTLIEHNRSHTKIDLRSHDKQDGIVHAYQTSHPLSEIDYVVSLCRVNKSKNILILYRDRLNKMQLEYQLKKARLNYTVNDSTEIVDRSAFRVYIAMMKIAAKIYDVYDLEIVAKGIKSLGTTTVARIKGLADSNTQVSDKNGQFDMFAAINGNETFHQKVSKLAEADKKIKRGCIPMFKLQGAFNKMAKDELKLSNIVKLFPDYMIKSFDVPKAISDFLEDVADDYDTSAAGIEELCNNFGLDGKEERFDEDAKIELSTIHGMKGGEGQMVILPFCNWKFKEDNRVKDIYESERRLFYVAVTRAKESLYLTYSGFDKPQFLKEMGV